jgi:hypothetical protein
MEHVSGWAEDGGTSVVITGTQGSGTQRFQQSFRGATVTVFDAGTATVSSIFSDDLGTPTAKANPFTADATTGRWDFYAANGAYDIQFSGGGIPAPFTIATVTLSGITFPIINAKDGPFNATGDGTTNDLTALQAAVDALPAGKGTVYIPAGTYNLGADASGLIVQGSGITIIGDSAGSGNAGTTLLYTGAGAALGINPQTSGAATTDRFKISDIKISGSSSGAIGILLGNTAGAVKSANGELHNVYVTGFDTAGFRFVAGQIISLFNCVAQGNTGADGFHFASGAQNTIVNFFGGRSVSNQVGVQIDQGTQLHWYGTTFELNTKEGCVVSKSTGVAIAGLVFSGCWWESNNSSQTGSGFSFLRTELLSGSAAGSILVESCEFNMSGVSNETYNLAGGPAPVTLINNRYLSSATPYGLYPSAGNIVFINEGVNSTNWTIVSTASVAAIDSSGQIQHANGAAATPSSHAFQYPTTGRYWASGPAMYESINGVKLAAWAAGGLTLERTSGDLDFLMFTNTSGKTTHRLQGYSSSTTTTTGDGGADIQLRNFQNTANAFNAISSYDSNGSINNRFVFQNVDQANNEGAQLRLVRANGGANPVLLETLHGNGSFQWHAYGAGTLTSDGSGNITAVSDERLKTDIRDFDYGLAEVLELQPIMHKWAAEAHMDMVQEYPGFTAQGVGRVMPKCRYTKTRSEETGIVNGQVTEIPLDEPVEDKMQSYSLHGVVCGIVNSIKELNDKIDALHL